MARWYEHPQSHWRQACVLCTALLSAGTGAQNKALDLAQDKQLEVPPAMREDLRTIGRYAQAVNQRTSPSAAAPATPSSVATTEHAAPTAATPVRRTDSVADPFEVSPQLRQNRRAASAFGGLPTATKLDLRRRIQVKALLVTTHGRMAQLDIDGSAPSARNDSNVLTVMDGELVDFGELGTYVVRISARDGVTLTNPGSPQSSRISLR